MEHAAGSSSGPPPVFVISGGVGASGEQLVRTVLAQFTGPEVPLIIVPHAQQIRDVRRIIERAAASGGIVVHTMVDGNLRRALIELARERNVPNVDLMGPLLDTLADALGQAPAGRPGLYRQRRETYFERVEAIEFTVAHDDGQKIDELSRAQIVLVGPSRAGKTPLSMYLSMLGWQVANVPLIPEIPPPEELFRADRRRVVGLTVEPGQLITFRLARQRRLGAGGYTSYTDPVAVYEEVETARRLFRRHGFGIVDATDKPIETSADEVLALLEHRLKLEQVWFTDSGAHNA